MELLFAHSFFMAFDEKQRLVQAPYPPLGTLIAAACARREGHQVSLFDAMVSEDLVDFEAILQQRRPEAVIFFEDNFNWLSKMCLERMRAACLAMISSARQRGCLVLVAGSDASDYPEVYLQAGADYVVKGEAEFRILDLLLGKNLEAKGVYRLEGEQLRGEEPARGERNLAVFPMAAWDLVDMARYRDIWTAQHGYFSLNIVTTRGCPYRCNWCAKPIHGRRYDVRLAEDVAAEMAFLKQTYAPDHIWFADDIFGLKPGWVKTFADALEANGGAIPFKIQARADLMSATMAADLGRAGCQTVWMGVESGSQKVLDGMDKDLDVACVADAVTRLRQHKIRSCFFIQFGYPGEEAADIQATWQLIATALPDEIGISVAYPLPNTPFFEKVQGQLGSKDHWAHSHEMMPIFQATYPSNFYPVLYQYIHQLFGQLRSSYSWFTLRGWVRRMRHWQTRRRLKNFGVQGVPFA